MKLDEIKVKVDVETDELKAEIAVLEAKFEEEKAKYNTRLTRKACALVGAVAFVAGFVAKATLF